jgi:hypothetical protein
MCSNFFNILFILLMSLTGFAQEYDETPTIMPLNLNYRVAKSNCKTDSLNDFLAKISRKFTETGTVYDFHGTDWMYLDEYLMPFLDSVYKTKIFKNISCTRRIYYCPLNYDSSASWVEIKEWTFSNVKEATLASHFINDVPFSKEVPVIPLIWFSIAQDNKLYFICTEDGDMWFNNRQYIIDIISSKFDSNK